MGGRTLARWVARSWFIAAAVLAATAAAQDWPQWRGANRDGKAPFAAPDAWPQQLKRQWRVSLGPGDATPALVGGRLYVFTRQGDQEVMVCLDAASGQERWRDGYGAEAVRGPAARHPGPRSSPAVGEGKVVALGVAGVLSCWSAADGKLAWRRDPFPGVHPRFYTAASPLIVDGLAVAHLGGAGNGALIAYRLDDGREAWRWAGEGPEYASPVLLEAGGAKQVVTLTEQSVVGVALEDGKLLWRLPFPSQSRAYNAATPIVDGDVVIYCGARRGVFAVRIGRTGGEWRTTQLWGNEELAPQFNTPVLKDGFLYGVTDRGNLFCINAQTGQTAWTDAESRDRGFGSIVDAGDALLALTSGGQLLAYKPNPQAFVLQAAIQVAESGTYAHPVAVGERLYIRDQESLTAYVVP